MREQYWPVVQAVAGDLAAVRADAELAQVSAYLNAHQDAGDLFDLLDELAGPGGAALARGAQMAQHYAAVRDACQRLRDVPPADLPEAVAWAARLLRYRVSQLPPLRAQPPLARSADRPAPPPPTADRPGLAAAPAGRPVPDARRPGPPAARPGGPPPAARPAGPRHAAPPRPQQAPAAAGAPPVRDQPGRAPSSRPGAPPTPATPPGGPP